MCAKKCLTKSEAAAILKHNKHHSKQYRKEQRSYYCKDCNSWHLTSQEDLTETLEIKIINKKRWKKLLMNN